MAAYQVEILRRVQKQLASCPRDVRERLTAAIRELGGAPRPQGCAKLMGRDGWRIRVGDHRVLYVVNDRSLRVVVVDVGHRKEVYR